MKTEFVSFQLSLAEMGEHWQSTVEDRLSRYGEPLRWAITHINQANQTATVEAVVTQADQ